MWVARFSLFCCFVVAFGVFLSFVMYLRFFVFFKKGLSDAFALSPFSLRPAATSSSASSLAALASLALCPPLASTSPRPGASSGSGG